MTKFASITSAAVLALAGTVFAQSNSPTVVTFTYTDLSGSYAGNAISGNFTARASAVAPLTTSGTVSRILPMAATTVFSPGFEATAGLSDAVFNISVYNKTAFTALGAGTMVLTDFDGDQIKADITGTWVQSFGGRNFFNGNLSRVTFVNNSGTNQFNSSPSDPGFNMSFYNNGLLTGALVQLQILRSNVGFFNVPFSNNAVQTSGQIIPTPGAMALLGVGGLLAARRRRA